MRPWQGLFMSVAIGGTALAACQLIAGIDDRKVFVPDGAADSSIDAPGPDADVCHAGPMIPTPAGGSSPSDNGDFVSVLHSLDLGLDGGLGYNLDQQCTCPDPGSCNQPDGGRVCDDPGAGVDNVGRYIFSQFSIFITQDSMNASINIGAFGAFVRIARYNGKANDDNVDVAVYSSLGYENYPSTQPAWDGGDPWIVDNASLQGAGDAGDFQLARNKASLAYVSGYTLVAFVKIPVVIGSASQYPITVELDSGLIVAQLNMSADGKTLLGMTGVLAGRWDTQKLLTSLQTLPDPINQAIHICDNNGSGAYQFVAQVVCGSVDVVADNSADNKGITCNAVSMALGFQASPARFGSQQNAPSIGTPCGAAYSADCL